MKIPHEVNDDLKKCFSERLQKLRKEKYNSQEKFSEAMDVSVETVKKWEQGKAFPETGHLLLIPDVLDCDLDYLIGRIDHQSRNRKISQDYTGLSERAVKILHGWNQNPKAKNAITALNDLVECGMFFATRVLFKIKDYIILRAVSEGKPTVNIDLFDIEIPEDERLFNQQIKEEKTIQNAKHLKELARFDLMNGLSDCVLTIYDRRKSVSK